MKKRYLILLLSFIWMIVIKAQTPISKWGLNENSGTIVFDSIGNNHGVVYGSEWTEGLIGSALNFDGVNDSLIIPHHVSLNSSSSISFSVWIKPKRHRSAKIIEKGDWNGHGLYQDVWNGWGVHFRINGNTHSINWQEGLPIIDRWYHIVGVFDGTSIILYVDGVEKNRLQITGTLSLNSFPIRIGSADKQKLFCGLIDEVSFYNYPLTTQEISQIYNTIAPVDHIPDPVGYWKFNETSGTTILDENGINHGSIIGSNYTSGISGTALQFNGSSNYVLVPNHTTLNPTNEITLAAWIKWSITPTDGAEWASIINKNVDNQYRLHHNQQNTAFEFAIRTSGNKWVKSITAPEINKWYFVVGTYNGQSLNIYVNGVLEGSVSHTGQLTQSNAPINIGRRTSNDRYFNGLIDEVMVYDRALNQQEISWLYESFIQNKITWTGNQNSSWNLASNWDPQTIPGLYDQITITKGTNQPTLSENIFIHSMVIDSNATLTLEPGGHLTLTHNLTNYGTILILSNALGEGSLIIKGNLNGFGSAQIQKFYSSNPNSQNQEKWHLISSPIANGEAAIFNNMVLFAHDESLFNWTQNIINPNTPLVVGKGYLLQCLSDETRSYSGVINHGDIGPLILRRNSTLIDVERGWNLIGNPYPSAIDWNAQEGWTKNNVENGIYIWNNHQYATYINGIGTNGGTNIIALGQGFFVRAASDSATITMSNKVRVHSGTFLKNEKSKPQMLKVVVSGNQISDETIIYYDPNATIYYDGAFDAAKLFGSTYAPQLFSEKNGNKIAIQALNDYNKLNDLFLYFIPGVNTLYTLNYTHSFPHFDNFIIKDLLTNNYITPNTNYSFQAKNTDPTKRFQIITDSDPLNTISIWASQKIVNVLIPINENVENISVINLNGQNLLNTSKQIIDLNTFSSGVYIIIVKTDKQTKISKVVIK